MRLLVPEYILLQLKNNKKQGKLQAGVLIVEISSYAKQLYEYMERGKRGAEQFAKMLSDFWEPAIQVVSDCGGFVSSMTGESLTALFPAKGRYLQRLLTASWQINHLQSTMGKEKEGKPVIRTGVGMGVTTWHLYDSPTNMVWSFWGEGVQNAIRAIRYSRDREIVLSPELTAQTTSFVTAVPILQSHAILKELTPIAIKNSEKPQLDHLRLQNKFLPRGLHSQKAKGEFREVVTCLLVFPHEYLQDDCLHGMIGLVSQFGGYLNKIGCGEKGALAIVLFGAPLAQVLPVKRAADFLLEVQKLFSKARAVMTTGNVFSGFVGSNLRSEYTTLGISAYRAKRMGMICHKGEILIDQACYNLLDKQYEKRFIGSFRIGEERSQELIYLLERPLSYDINQFRSYCLVGRDKELSALRETLQNTSIRAIQLIGREGMGKTRLVTELVRKNNNGYRWVMLHFHLQYGDLLQFVYALIAKLYFDDEVFTHQNCIKKLSSAIRKWKENGNIDTSQTKYKALPEFFASLLFPRSLSIETTKQDAISQQKNIEYYLISLLAAESLHHNTCIVIDGAENLSETTLQVLSHIAQLNEVDGIKYLLLTQTKRAIPLPTGSMCDIVLSPLTREESKEYINKWLVFYSRERLLRPVSDSLYDFLYNRSEGTPFFIEQYLLYLYENGLLYGNFSQESNLSMLPNSVESLIVSRLDSLPMETVEVLRAAALWGGEFEIGILEKILQWEDIATWLYFAEKVGIVDRTENNTYRFHSNAIKDTIELILLPDDAANLHEQIANYLAMTIEETNPEALYSLATHRGIAGNKAVATQLYQNAAQLFKKKYRLIEAISAYQHALTFADEESEQGLIKRCLGDVYFMKGEFVEAEKNYREAYQIALQTENTEEMYSCQFGLGKTLIELNNPVDSHLILNEAYELAVTANNLYRQFAVLCAISSLFAYRGDLQESQSYLLKAYPLAEQLEDHGAKAALCINLGNNYGQLHQLTEEEAQYRKAYEIAKQYNILTYQGQSMISLARCFAQKGELNQALELLNQSLQLYTEMGNFENIAKTHSNLGNALFYAGELTAAMKHLQIAEEMSLQLKSDSIAYQCLQLMGVIYQKWAEWDQAEACYEKQKVLAIKSSEHEKEIKAVINSAILAYQRVLYPKAIALLEQAIQLAETHQYPNFKLTAINNLALIYKEQAKYTKALELRLQILHSDSMEKMPNLARLDFYNNLSDLYMAMGFYSEAESYFSKLLTESQTLKHQVNECYAKGNLAELYVRTKRWEDADRYIGEAIEFGERANLTEPVSGFYFQKALIWQHEGNIVQAKEVLEKALALAKTANRRDVMCYGDILQVKLMDLPIKDKMARLTALLPLYTEPLFMAEIYYQVCLYQPRKLAINRMISLYEELDPEKQVPLFQERVKQLFERE